MTTILLSASVQGGVAIALIWLVCQLARTMNSSARAWLWWLASLKLIASLLPAVVVPFLFASAIPIPPIAGLVSSSAGPEMGVAATTFLAPVSTVGLLDVLLRLVLAVWLIGIVAHACHLLLGYARTRRIVRRATSLGPGDVAIVNHLAELIGLRSSPQIRVSREIETPMVVGVLRAIVLLPAAGMGALSDRERTMAIAHELAHVYRRDLMFGWVPAIAERLFFFHPLARVAAREYAVEREAACDAHVVRAMDLAPREYGEMLVHLGVVRSRSIFAAGGSSPSMSSLKRRINMLRDVPSARSRRVMVAVVGLSVLALLPYQLVRSTVQASQAVAAVSSQPASPAQAKRAGNSLQRQPATPAQAAPAPVSPSAAASSHGVRRPSADEPAPASEAVFEQRAALLETERAFAALRAEYEATIAREEAAFKSSSRRNEIQRNAEYRKLEDAYRQAQVQDTRQFLQEQLRTLHSEQEQMSVALQDIAKQIESIRRQLERVPPVPAK